VFKNLTEYQKLYIQTVLWMTAGGIGLLNLSSHNTRGANFCLCLLGTIGIYKTLEMVRVVRDLEENEKAIQQTIKDLEN
jgi:hypothetical protein